MKASKGRLSSDVSAQARRHSGGGAFGGSYPKSFLCLWKFCCAQKTKIFPPKYVLFPPDLKTWLRAWFCQNRVCN